MPSLFHVAKIPASLRLYARSCAEAEVSPGMYGAWSLHLSALTVEEPLRARALHCLDAITLKQLKGPLWVVSEKEIKVDCVVPQGVSLVAPRVVFKQEQMYALSVYANQVVHWQAPSDLNLMGLCPTWLQLGYQQILPPSLEAQVKSVTYLDTPRTAPLPGVRVFSEPPGFTLWHLLALGLMDDLGVDSLLSSLHSIEVDTLITDLKEATQGIPTYYSTELKQWSAQGVGAEEFTAVTAFRTPFELCMLIQSPMLSQYTYNEPVPPVLQKFIEQTETALNPKEE